ncbi:hypothetical protein [Stutzerimonas stutzeri]|uniref:hypothetical protein n=1 Tax=Stutzerimonas stutzeri TaxID=316 RepID=UPI0011AFC9D1|nr:hypothetical protein [Stutzerimonas stutzeri]MCQ4261595.1 hypothetical protein [Stutzerimonas stutzeri]
MPYRPIACVARRTGKETGRPIPLASDDEQAIKVAAQLVEDAGFDPVIVGPLASAKRFDFQTGISTRAFGPQLRETLGL